MRLDDDTAFFILLVATLVATIVCSYALGRMGYYDRWFLHRLW